MGRPFIKTPDLWDSETYRRLETGELKLQRGQWVYCGDRKYKSRFHEVTIKEGEIWHIRAFHGPKAAQKFMEYGR